jgi:hypothetical protein
MNGGQKLGARHGGGSPLHDHQGASDIGEVSGLERRSAACQGQGKGGANGVASTGHVDGLIAAMTEYALGFYQIRKAPCQATEVTNREFNFMEGMWRVQRAPVPQDSRHEV